MDDQIISNLFVRMLNEWLKYSGDYEKEFYDIKLLSGEIILYCWPNANTFHVLDNSGRIVDGEEVAFIRISDER